MPPSDRVAAIDAKVDSNFKWTVGVFGGGFITLIIAFAAGFMILLTRLDAREDRVVTKLDAISASLSEVKTDVAVLKDRAESAKP